MVYMLTFTINIPQMLAYIPAPWIRHGICQDWESRILDLLICEIFSRWDRDLLIYELFFSGYPHYGFKLDGFRPDLGIFRGC